ncbi:16241_t:CDS:1, partial [Racocetra fulgida]
MQLPELVISLESLLIDAYLKQPQPLSEIETWLLGLITLNK